MPTTDNLSQKHEIARALRECANAIELIETEADLMHCISIVAWVVAIANAHNVGMPEPAFRAEADYSDDHH